MNNKEENIRSGFKGMYSILSTTPEKPSAPQDVEGAPERDTAAGERPSFGRGRPRKNGEGRKAPNGLVYTSLALDASLRSFIDDYAYEKRLSIKSAYNELLDLCRRLYTCNPEAFEILCNIKEEERLSAILSSIKEK